MNSNSNNKNQDTNSAPELDEDFLDWEGSRPAHFPFTKHIIAGSMAGVMEHVGMFPVDTIKTHMQVSSTHYGFCETASLLYKSEGLWRFWKGASVIASGCIPAHAAYFTSYELGKRKFAKEDGEFHFLGAAFIGSLSTIFHDLFITPCDVIKQRMQLRKGLTFWKCFNKITKDEGPRALYRSFFITLLMNMPNAAVVVMVNENAKVVVKPKERKHPMLWYFLCAGTAGGASAVLLNPLDVVKTKLQTQNVRPSCEKMRDIIVKEIKEQTVQAMEQAKKDKQIRSFHSSHRHKHIEDEHEWKTNYKSVIATVKKIKSESGYAGFTRGVSARLIANIPAVAISWGTYETLKNLLIESDTKKE